MQETFEISVETRGSAAVVRVRGRLDARTTPELLRRCAGARPPGGHLVLNLAEVRFVSSSGVGALLSLTEQAREDGGSIRISPASPPVHSSIQLLNLDQYLTVDASESDGLAALEAA